VFEIDNKSGIEQKRRTIPRLVGWFLSL